MTSSEMTPADIAAVTGNRGNGNFGFGDGSWWIIILFLFGMFNGGWGNNGNGGTGNLYPWLNNSNQINDGFQNQLINDNITSIREGVFGIQNQLSNGRPENLCTFRETRENKESPGSNCSSF